MAGDITSLSHGDEFIIGGRLYRMDCGQSAPPPAAAAAAAPEAAPVPVDASAPPEVVAEPSHPSGAAVANPTLGTAAARSQAQPPPSMPAHANVSAQPAAPLAPSAADLSVAPQRTMVADGRATRTQAPEGPENLDAGRAPTLPEASADTHRDAAAEGRVERSPRSKRSRDRPPHADAEAHPLLTRGDDEAARILRSLSKRPRKTMSSPLPATAAAVPRRQTRASSQVDAQAQSPSGNDAARTPHPLATLHESKDEAQEGAQPLEEEEAKVIVAAEPVPRRSPRIVALPLPEAPLIVSPLRLVSPQPQQQPPPSPRPGRHPDTHMCDGAHTDDEATEDEQPPPSTIKVHLPKRFRVHRRRERVIHRPRRD